MEAQLAQGSSPQQPAQEASGSASRGQSVPRHRSRSRSRAGAVLARRRSASVPPQQPRGAGGAAEGAALPPPVVMLPRPHRPGFGLRRVLLAARRRTATHTRWRGRVAARMPGRWVVGEVAQGQVGGVGGMPRAVAGEEGRRCLGDEWKAAARCAARGRAAHAWKPAGMGATSSEASGAASQLSNRIPRTPPLCGSCAAAAPELVPAVAL